MKHKFLAWIDPKPIAFFGYGSIGFPLDPIKQNDKLFFHNCIYQDITNLVYIQQHHYDLRKRACAVSRVITLPCSPTPFFQLCSSIQDLNVIVS